MRGYTEPHNVTPATMPHHAATYVDSGLNLYRGNPLIEALPPIRAGTEIAATLRRYPAYNDTERSLPSHLRLHAVDSARQFFEPLPLHLDLADRCSRMIRSGYLARNPLQRNHWHKLHKQVDQLYEPEPPLAEYRHSADGFSLIGISGGGKTSAVQAILELYPQVIVHNNYQRAPFSHVQVVWLKLECPYDGSVKGLCLNFLQAMDRLLGTSYHRDYARGGSRTTDELLPAMAHVAALHSLGVLVIDELQHLSGSKSGGTERMLNFFVQLQNTIGVPVVLIGTYKALPILNGEFRQIRRSCGQGDLVWNRMQQDDTWEYFAQSLWRFQYLRRPTPFTSELSTVLYEECQGITDFAVKLYLLAQVRAISTGDERITSGLIRSVARDSFQTARPVLRALRNNDLLALQEVSDVHTVDFNLHLREEQRKAAMTALRPAAPNSAPAVAVPATNHPATAPAVSPPAPTAPRSAARKSKSVPAPDSLMGIADAGLKQGLAAYDALLEAKLIRNVAEFLSNPIAP